jgi:hypothetical protein
VQHQVIAPVLFLLFPLALAVFWCAIVIMLSILSGWRRLAQSYATDLAPRGTAFLCQSGYVGFVAYRNCLSARVASEGLFLSVLWPFRPGHKTLLIPWSAIHDEEPRQVFWLQFTRFQIGTPSIGRLQLPAKVLEAQRAVA